MAPSAPGEHLTQIDYFFNAGKIAFYETQRKPDDAAAKPLPNSRPQSICVAFDGEKTSWLMTSNDANSSMGVVYAKDANGVRARNYAPLIAVGLWLDAEQTLKSIGWTADGVRIANSRVKVDDRECVRMAFRRRGVLRTDQFVGHLDVDPALGCIPVQWQTYHDRIPGSQTKIEYAADSSLPGPSEWVYQSFSDADGLPETVQSARPIASTLNQAIEDSRFEIEFPEGTRVFEK